VLPREYAKSLPALFIHEKKEKKGTFFPFMERIASSLIYILLINFD